MSIPLFVIQLKYSTIPGLVTLGKYDGSHSCLTAATTGGKVITLYYDFYFIFIIKYNWARKIEDIFSILERLREIN